MSQAGTRQTHEFLRSARIPIYAVAFAVGDFDELSVTQNGVAYRALVPPGRASWAEPGFIGQNLAPQIRVLTCVF